tara:strand:+ start:2079 stop:2789 length:711 start_codon:yes stop_codon:yes gene_type:complete
MAGRRTRNNCPFCQHSDRDDIEHQIRVGTLKPEDMDKEENWASGTSHRHMRRHSGEYHNNSNEECPICTHPERSVIESSLIDGLSSIEDFAYELEVSEEVISMHLEKHIRPLIKEAATLEMVPTALASTKDSLLRIEKNMNRLDTIFSMQLDRIESQFIDAPDMVSPKDIELAVRLHREVRETLSELAVWMDKMEVIDNSQTVNVITVIQAHFAEKSPDEWRVLRNALAKAGVLEG